MRRLNNYSGPILAACLIASGLVSAASAQTTETVTTRTTTVETPTTTTTTTFSLPSSSSYIVVDPLTGVIKGDYVTGVRTVNGIPLTSNYVVMDKVSRRLVGTFDTSGNLIDVSTAPAASEVIVSIDSKRSALEKQIDSFLAQGQITAAQADTLRAEIHQLYPGQTTLSRTVTYNNAMIVDSGLNNVESRLSLFPLVQKTYTSKVLMPKFVTVNGQVILPDALTYRKLQLERRVEDEYAFGHLTKDQFTQLKSDMVEVSSKEGQYRVGGTISDTNAQLMAADLNAVQAKMEQYVAKTNANLKIGTN